MRSMRSGAVDRGDYVELVRCSCHDFGSGDLLAVFDYRLLALLENVHEVVCVRWESGCDE